MSSSIHSSYPSNYSPSSTIHTAQLRMTLTNEQKAVVKDFFDEFKGKEQEALTFLRSLKAMVGVKHFPIMLLIGKDKNGLYHNTPQLQKHTDQMLKIKTIAYEMVCTSDPQKTLEELETIRAKYI